jgi:CBS domain containing-hemolysin-like protein
MVPRVNIFLLDASSQLNARLLARLSRYYFTKFLLYSRYEDNVIGYLQFKQLLAYTPDQRIMDQPSVIRRDIV